MNHPHLSFSLDKDAPQELQARRGHWTSGHPVQLADGECWRLPQINWGLILFQPDVLAAISRTFELADKVWQVDSDANRQLMATAIYHSQLAQLGVSLLQHNYDLPGEQWRRLISFEHLRARLQLTLAVSEAVAAAIPAWMPFYLLGGLEEEPLLLN